MVPNQLLRPTIDASEPVTTNKALLYALTNATIQKDNTYVVDSFLQSVPRHTGNLGHATTRPMDF